MSYTERAHRRGAWRSSSSRPRWFVSVSSRCRRISAICTNTNIPMRRICGSAWNLASVIRLRWSVFDRSWKLRGGSDAGAATGSE